MSHATGVWTGTPTTAQTATTYTVWSYGSNHTDSLSTTLSITIHGGTTATVSPARGDTAGGTAFKVYWPGAVTSSGNTITIGGVTATSITRISADSLSGVSPAGTGSAAIVVGNSLGDVASAGNWTYTAAGGTHRRTRNGLGIGIGVGF
jgi:hypothetical protein